MKRKIMLAATLLVLITVLPMASATLSTLSDATNDLMLTTEHGNSHGNWDTIVPAAPKLQIKYNYIDVVGASVDCNGATCTLTLTVSGIVAPTSGFGSIKYVRYVWRFYDSSGNLLYRIFCDWSSSTGWKGVQDDQGNSFGSSVANSGNHVTIILPGPFPYLPSNIDHWSVRAWNSQLPDAGHCPADMPATALGCPTYLWDGAPNAPFYYS